MITNGFTKKQDKLPPTEKKRALNHRADYLARTKKDRITMAGKTMSTYEREMQDPSFKEQFEKEYKEFALSELILAMMEEDDMSVRGLAKAVGISP